MTPHSSSGFSPFLLTHGWEPSTPSQVLYQAWVGKDMGDTSIEDWVNSNSERVQTLRDAAIVSYGEVSEKRKQKSDATCQVRTFDTGQSVWYRTPGLSETLEPAWQGPYVVEKALGGPSYIINFDGKLKNVRVRFLKANVQRVVKRVTTVLEDDSIEDDVTCTNIKISLRKVEKSKEMIEDIRKLLSEFEDVVKKEPGLTDWVELGINTGDAAPVSQRPYNTPVALREAVGKEVQWLLDQGYIRASHSEWASPIVTVKKPDGSIRLCIDYKRLNAVTTPAPFYMPTIEEKLEKAGTARYISTVDLNKGYYQVGMSRADIEKTAFVCHKGHFKFVRMPFGLKNAPAAFQKLTNIQSARTVLGLCIALHR